MARGSTDDYFIGQLQVYILDDRQLYRQYREIWKTLESRVKSGTYNRASATKAYRALVDMGAKKSCDESGGFRVSWIYPAPERRILANYFVGLFEYSTLDKWAAKREALKKELRRTTLHQ